MLPMEAKEYQRSREKPSFDSNSRQDQDNNINPCRLDVAVSVAVRHLVDGLGLSHLDLSVLLDVDHRAVRRWLEEDAQPHKSVRIKLARLHALRNRLVASLGGEENAAYWLRQESELLAGFTPLDAIMRDRVHMVLAMLDALDTGMAFDCQD